MALRLCVRLCVAWLLSSCALTFLACGSGPATPAAADKLSLAGTMTIEVPDPNSANNAFLTIANIPVSC